MPIDLKDIAALGTLLSQAVGAIKKLRESKLADGTADAVADLTDIVSDASGRLFALQSTLVTLQQENLELAAQIDRMTQWDTEKRRYKMAAPFPGCVVYALQKTASDGEPAHYICASCFQRGEKSILQGRLPPQPKSGQGYAPAQYFCPVCKSEATTPWINIPQPQYFEEITPQG